MPTPPPSKSRTPKSLAPAVPPAATPCPAPAQKCAGSALPTRRFRATIAYDGTPYFGWQRQPNRPTIQGTLETALARLLGLPPSALPVTLHSCGRTDTGVHALAQVAHFDLPNAPTVKRPNDQTIKRSNGQTIQLPWTAPALQKGWNALLPPSIRILALRPASPAFHARYDARAKEYRYRIWNAPVASPLECRTALHVRTPLDLAAMRAAAAYLVGTHDFAAFSANPHRETSGTTRTIFSLTITRRGPLITLAVIGNGFLYKMVRSIAGYLIRVGRHAIPAAETPSILTSLTRTARVETAPPHALLLHRIYYSPLSSFPPPSHP